MTIDQTVSWIAWSLLLTAVVLLALGIRRVVQASQLRYFLFRREQATSGWRVALVGAAVGLAAVVVFTLGRPAAYVIVPPTPSITPTLTPSVTPSTTATPTITVTPSISLTPSITPTATETPTPMLPEQLRNAFQDTVTPRPDAVLSPVLVATALNPSNLAIQPTDVFDNPLGRLYGAFTYDNLQDGVRWSALWYHGDNVVCFETKPWDGGTGGYGYTECLPEGGWLEGSYEIQVFIGEQWKSSARFEVRGAPATATPSPSATP